jgi:cytoskeleton protein RodZ
VTGPAALHVMEDGGGSISSGPGASAGSRLAEARRRSGQSLEQVAAATRLRRSQLQALERDDFAALPGPVYARGYLKTYAEYLGLDPAELLVEQAMLPPALPAPDAARRRLSLGPLTPAHAPARLVLTRPALAGAGLVLAALLFGAYAWREMDSARSFVGAAPAATPAVGAPPIASPQPLPSISPATPAAGAAPAVRQVFVAVKATEPSWLSVSVDGKSAFAGLLNPGDEVTFVGQKVTLSAGKPSLLVALSGGEYHELGVLNKVYSADT